MSLWSHSYRNIYQSSNSREKYVSQYEQCNGKRILKLFDTFLQNTVVDFWTRIYLGFCDKWENDTLGSACSKWKEAKKNVCSKLVLVVTELFNIAVNDIDAKESARYSRVLVVN